MMLWINENQTKNGTIILSRQLLSQQVVQLSLPRPTSLWNKFIITINKKNNNS